MSHRPGYPWKRKVDHPLSGTPIEPRSYAIECQPEQNKIEDSTSPPSQKYNSNAMVSMLDIINGATSQVFIEPVCAHGHDDEANDSEPDTESSNCGERMALRHPVPYTYPHPHNARNNQNNQGNDGC